MPVTFNATPTCYYAKDNLIVLEDLKSIGYEMADRKVGLNFKQITAVLDELANFHAISLAIKILHPQEFYMLLNAQDGISEGLFIKENEEWYRDYYKQAIQNVLDMVTFVKYYTSCCKGKEMVFLGIKEVVEIGVGHNDFE